MSRFAIRPMRPDDKPAMVGIASRTWEGNDYLPYVFDAWLADAEGEFAAVEMDGRVIGCGKLSFVAPGHAWLEGLRKDPAVSVGGLAEAVSRHFLRRLAGRPGLRSIRFATYVFNERSIAANERLGFERRRVLSCKAWAPKRAELEAALCPEASRAVAVTDGDEAARFVEAGDWLSATGGLVCEGWRAVPYSAAWFAARYAATGRCLGVRGEDGRLAGLAAFAPEARGARSYVKLAFLDAVDRGSAHALLDALVRAAKALAADENEFELILPPRARVKDWIAERGFASWEREDDYFVYEFPLGRLPGIAAEGEAT